MNHGTNPHQHPSKHFKATAQELARGATQQVGPRELEGDMEETMTPTPWLPAIPELLTTHELAKILRLKPQTIRKKRMDGTMGIEPIKVGGRLLWKKSDLLDLLRRLQH